MLPDTLVFIERDWLSANQVLMHDGDDKCTVIDTGYAKHIPMTVQLVARALHQAPQGPARLARIINTHLHSDHCGGNAALASAHGCEVLVPAACLEAVRIWDTDALSYRITGQRCPRFSATAALAPGDTFVGGGLTWQVHGAPGHDPTSLIFFNDAHRILLSADALWENGFGVIFPELLDASGFREQAAVLDLIESLAPALVIPGHGPLFADAPAAIARARSRLAALTCDPQRNDRNALKVLVKFLLLDHESLSLGQLTSMAEGADAMRAAATGLGMSLEQALAWAVDSLHEAGQIVRRDDMLHNA